MSTIGYRRGLPPNALALDLGLRDPAGRPKIRRRVLVYGELAPRSQRYLSSHGAALTQVDSAVDALFALADAHFDVVVLDPRAPGGGLALVKTLKLGHRLVEAPEELVAKASARARQTPFIVLPLPDDAEFAVVVQVPDAAWLDDGLGTRLEDVILRLDVSRLRLAWG